eukprot:4065032-Pleurochrysis_carterae.AAC.1
MTGENKPIAGARHRLRKLLNSDKAKHSAILNALSSSCSGKHAIRQGQTTRVSTERAQNCGISNAIVRTCMIETLKAWTLVVIWMLLGRFCDEWCTKGGIRNECAQEKGTRKKRSKEERGKDRQHRKLEEQ